MGSDNIKVTYEYFRLAMRDCIENKARTGMSVKIIAYALGVKSSRVSMMHKEGTKKPANFDQQVTIAGLANMSYEEFLRHGKNLYEIKHGISGTLQSSSFVPAHAMDRTNPCLERLDRIADILEKNFKRRAEMDSGRPSDPLPGVGGGKKQKNGGNS